MKAKNRKKKARRAEEDEERMQAKKRKRGKGANKQYDEAELEDMSPEDGQCR